MLSKLAPSVTGTCTYTCLYSKDGNKHLFPCVFASKSNNIKGQKHCYKNTRCRAQVRRQCSSYSLAMKMASFAPSLLIIMALPLVLAAPAPAPDSLLPHVRQRRSLLQLEQVMACTTGISNPFTIIKTYNCYGCYCGISGAGQPVDGIDECCFYHDMCYAALEANGTCNPKIGEIYFSPYKFECVKPSNLTDNETGDGSIPVCKSALNQCGAGLCGCDVEFALCLRQYPVPQERKKCPTERFCLGNFKSY